MLETSGSNPEHDEDKLGRFLERGLERGDILDGMMTNENSKVAQIWQLRELIPTALLKEKYSFKYDISLPLTHFYDIVPVLQKRLGNMVDCVAGFGHMGDSNLHLQIMCDEFTNEVYQKLEPFVYEYTTKLRGSISAEHGIGFLKRNYLQRFKQSEAVDLMKQLKNTMDPNGILNPYKVLKQ